MEVPYLVYEVVDRELDLGKVRSDYDRLLVVEMLFELNESRLTRFTLGLQYFLGFYGYRLDQTALLVGEIVEVLLYSLNNGPISLTWSSQPTF